MILLVATLISTGLSLPTSAAAADTGSPYAQSMQRMMDLGIFSLTAPDKMDLDNPITREQLATVIILLTGQEDKISLYKNTSLFSDVPASRWSNGYIGAAVKFGYMTSAADGKFHPTSTATFAEIAKIFSELLNYEDFVLTGSYPYNYLDLMASLGIFDGISYSASGSVSRGQMVLMIDRLLQTEIFDGVHLFVDTVSVYKNMIVLENAKINKNSDERRILTDAGFYSTDASLKMPEAGKKYVARLKNGEIIKMALANMEFQDVSIKYAQSGKILTNDGQTLYLPANVTCYYHGAVSNYDAINAALKTNSSLVIGTKSDGSGYAVLFDPIYSDPRVITSGTTTSMLEKLYGGKTIDREGKYISASQIEADDVVYEVTDIWDGNAYVIIYSNSVSGEVTAILPNKISPTSIQIDGKAYVLSKDFPIHKLVGQGGVEVDQTAKLLLSSDGQAIDILPNGDSDNGDYALVLNAYDQKSTNKEDFGTNKHYVTLLLSDGAKKTYWIAKDSINLKGKVVKYSVVEIVTGKDDYDVVELTEIDYGNASASRIDKENRMIDSSQVTNDVVIFNMINNIYGTDSQASVIKWADLPDGNLQSGRVTYIHKTGDFQDIDVILFNNILDEGVGYGLVTNVTSRFTPATGMVYTATIKITGNDYTYSYADDGGLFIGQVVRARISGTAVTGIDYSTTPAVLSNIVDAVDSTRIRINGVTYNYRGDAVILKYDGSAYKQAGTADIVKGNNGRNISVYLDKPAIYGGKVALIIIN